MREWKASLSANHNSNLMFSWITICYFSLSRLNIAETQWYFKAMSDYCVSSDSLSITTECKNKSDTKKNIFASLLVWYWKNEENVSLCSFLPTILSYNVGIICMKWVWHLKWERTFHCLLSLQILLLWLSIGSWFIVGSYGTHS